MSEADRDIADLFGPVRAGGLARPPAHQQPADPPGAVRRRLLAVLAGRWCESCCTKPRVFLEGGAWRIRCRCYPRAAYLRPAPKWMIEREEREDMNQQRDLANIGDPGTIVTSPSPIPGPMSIAQLKERQDMVKWVVETMRDGIDYGLIPGTQSKSLWEAGAEKLRAAFNIMWSYEIEERFTDPVSGMCRVRARAFQIIGAYGAEPIKGPAWGATCSSLEKQFTFTELATLPNVIEDRAIKRAFVNLMRNVTGASAFFKDAVADPADRKEVGILQWLTHCPEHGTKWRLSSKPEFSPSHAIAGEKNDKGKQAYCNMWQALKKPISDAATRISARLGWDVKKTTAWLAQAGGAADWKDVKVEERVKAIAAFESYADEHEPEAGASQVAKPDAVAQGGGSKPVPTDLQQLRWSAMNDLGLTLERAGELAGKPLDQLTPAEIPAAWDKLQKGAKA